MTIDCKKFHNKNIHEPRRNRKQWADFQEKNKRRLNEPIPIIYPNHELIFDPANPVWLSIRHQVEYVRNMKGWGPDPVDDSTRANWDWGYNLNDAIKLFDEGWDEGFSAIQHGMEQAAQAAMMAAMKEIVPVRDLHGSFIDIDSFIRGEPDCMFEFNEEVRPNLHLEVEIDAFVVCATDADEVLYRGAAVVAAIMALRRLGVFVTAYQKEICYTDTEDKSNKPVTVQVNILNQDITENMSEVLIALCHPGFHRKVFFQSEYAAWGCTTSAIAYDRRNSQDFYTKPGSGKIVIPGHFRYQDPDIDWGSSWASPKAAQALVHEMMKAAKSK